MRILHLVPTLTSGGAERQLRYLAEALADRDHEVHVAYVHEGPHEGWDEMGPVTLHRIAARSNYDPRIFCQLVGLVKAMKPDVVQTWITQMDVLGGLACGIAGATWILREPNSKPAYLRSWKFRLREAVAGGAEAIICNSEGGQRYWREFFPRKQVCVVRNALPLQDLERATRVSLADLGLEAGIPIVLYAGRLVGDHTSDKNLKRLLLAAKDMQQVVDVQMVLCGDGPQRLELERLAESIGLGARVKIMGHVAKETVWGLMKTAEVFVSVSHFEGMPNAVMEAMAIGCPLVVSDIVAHREFLTEDMALFVPVNDVDLIARGLLECLQYRRAARLRAESARRKTNEWMIESMGQCYEDVYRAVVESKTRGTRSGYAK